MEARSKGFCVKIWTCRSDSMSTPAENTRFKTSSRTGQHVETDSKATDREKRQVIKSKVHMQAVTKRNQLVNNWLATSVKTVSEDKKNFKQSAHSKKPTHSASDSGRRDGKGKLFKDKWDKYYKHCQLEGFLSNYQSKHQSQQSSEASEVLFNYKGRQSVKVLSVKTTDSSYCTAEIPIKSRMQDEDSEDIEIGHSAMSGRSSTARRRLEKTTKMKRIAQLHGRPLADYKHVNDHDNEHGNEDMVDLLSVHEGSTGPRDQWHRNPSVIVSEPTQHGGESRSNIPNSGRTETTQPQQDGEPGSPQPDPEEDDDAIKPDVIENFRKRLQEKDTDVFYDMFELIITKVSTVQNNLKEVRSQQGTINDRIDILSNAVDVIAQSVDDIDVEIEEVNDANFKLVQAAMKLESRVDESDNTLNKLTARINKGSLILNGLILDRSKTAKECVQEFIKQQLEIEDEVPIIAAHQMGKAKNSPVWFKLQNPDDVAVLYKNVAKLKGKVNSRNKKYLLREFTSEAEKERKIRQQDIAMENTRLPESHKIDIAFNRGNLLINGEEYKKALVEPQIKDAMFMTKEQENILDNLQVHRISEFSEQQSTFQTYMSEVDSLEKVQDFYHAVAKDHVSSTHVMIGYRVFGSQYFNLQDYCDDGEHGGGRMLLNKLKENKIWNAAIAVVRYHNGPNLGRRRFEILAEQCQKVIGSFPKPLNYGQYFTDQTTLRHLNTAVDRSDLGENSDEQQRNGRAGTRGTPRARGGRNSRRRGSRR